MTTNLDQTTHDTTAAASPLPVDLPGRAVDIIYAAARTAGVRLTGMSLSFKDDPAGGIRVLVSHLMDPDVATARRLIAALGEVAQVSEPYGPTSRRQADVEANVQALGGLNVVVIVVEGLPIEPSDPTDLIAQVDARRADEHTHQPAAEHIAQLAGESTDSPVDFTSLF